MFTYDFMQNALAACLIVALPCGVIGYFLLLRQQSFAGHALGHVGFAGATGAILLGISPFWGLLAITTLAGALMGALGERLAGRDVAIGMVLAVSLGLGLLFLNFFTSSAQGATALLFGNVLGVDGQTLWGMAAVSALTLFAMALLSGPLLYMSVAPDSAAARGVKLRLISVLFLAITGVAVAEAVQVVGVLLVFTLLIGPAAAAQLFTRRFERGMALAVLLAAGQAVFGIMMAFITDWPCSFWISTASAAVYLCAKFTRIAQERYGLRLIRE